MPVARAAASPPLDPPGVTVGSQGFLVAPRNALSLCQRRPKSGMLVRPMGMAPAVLIWAMWGASTGGSASAIATIPSVVAEPMRSMFSFTVTGTP
jgi:hypothetical protein